MEIRTIEKSSVGGQFVVRVFANGKAKCRAEAVRVLDDGTERLLTIDEINPFLKRNRDAFLKGIDDAEAREQSYVLLLECTDQLGLERDDALKNKPIEEADDRPTGFSDDALALAFTKKFGTELRYTAAWNKWHAWGNTHWAEDKTLAVFEKARGLCRQMADGAESPTAKATIRSAKTVASVERMARYDRVHAADPSQWDANQWHIATPGGVVELDTGTLRKAMPHDYMTKSTAVAPGGPCPRWLGFLQWATGDDDELVSFIQRMSGYMLTGSTREHALFFPYGRGGNGKGTMVNNLTGIMGDYATIAPMETFTESRGERHPTDLAMLRGARLVASQETERGRKWAESRVKALTGGDPVSARFMRQDFFTFQPEFKLLIAGNEKPAIASVDEAIRRRFHLIPFEQQITPEERDEQLPEKLRLEWPGIFAWMIEGCQLWLEQGLRPPARVQAATQAYLDEQDSFGTWLLEACKAGPRDWASSGDLFASWATWANRSGEESGTMKAFSSEMSKRGFTPKRDTSGSKRGFEGVSIKQDTENAYKSAKAENGYQREIAI